MRPSEVRKPCRRSRNAPVGSLSTLRHTSSDFVRSDANKEATTSAWHPFSAGPIRFGVSFSIAFCQAWRPPHRVFKYATRSFFSSSVRPVFRKLS